jgi:diguanylate cyclase (GGDEF)-like protein
MEGASQVSERIREHLAHAEFGGGRVTLSVGIAEFPANGDSPEAVIASADGAMYEAKRAGRDRVALAKRRESRTTRRNA